MAAVPTIGRATGVERKPSAPEADATRALYEQYSRQILNYCVHQLNSREEAEDAVQTTFMNAFRGLKRGVVPEAEQAWLFKIAENVCLSRRRSSWRRGKVESPNDFEVLQEIVPSKHANRADELIGLEDALEAMPENQRRAILLREWQGLSYREIADELELSQAAVETLIFRARRSLAAGLESPVAPKRRRRISAAGDGLSLGSLIAGLKSVLTGGAAVKAVAVAVAAGSATLAATQAEPALVHQLHHTAKPAAVVHVTNSSRATFSSQATVVAGASGLSVEQARKQSDRGASMNKAVARAGQNHGRARSVTMPEEVTHAQASPMVPMTPTVPAAAPTVPAPEAPTAAAPVVPHVTPATPTEQPKTEAPKPASPPSDSPMTAAPKSEPTKTGDSPGKSGNGNDGKRGDSGRSDRGAKADTPKADTPRAVSTPVAATPPAPVASAPAAPAPAALTQNSGGNNWNDKDKSKGADKKPDSPAPVPAAAAPVVAAPVAPAAPAAAPPVPTTNAPMHGNGNGGDNSKDNGGDKGRGKGK